MATIELVDEQIDAIVIDELAQAIEACLLDSDVESMQYNEDMVRSLKNVLSYFATQSQYEDIIYKLGA